MPNYKLMAADSGGDASPAGATRFYNVIGALKEVGSGNEAARQIIVRDTYTLKNLFVRIVANATTAGSTIGSRVNSANGAQSVSIGAGLTGVFEDTTNSDSLVTGNLIGNQIVAGAGGSVTTSIISYVLQTAANTTPILGSHDDATGQAASTTSFYSLLGKMQDNATETTVQYTWRVAATLSNLRVFILSNDRGASTVNFRKNAANGSQTVSIGGSTTGAFEDTTNTDSVAVADECNLAVTTGAGGTVFKMDVAQCKSNSAGQQMVVHDPTQAALSADNYSIAAGSLSYTTTETNTQKTARISFTAKNMFTNTIANTAVGSTDIYLRQNGANSALTVNIPTLVTGFVEDTTNSVSIVSGDTYNYFLDVGFVSGSIQVVTVGFELAQAAASLARNGAAVIIG